MDLESFYSEVCVESNEQQLFDVVGSWAKRLGFGFCCQGIRVPLSSHGLPTLHTSAASWRVHYCHDGFLAVDVSVPLTLRSSGLVVWSAKAFTSIASFRVRNTDIVRPAVQSWTLYGAHALLTLPHTTERLTAAETAHLSTRARWLSSLARNLMNEFNRQKNSLDMEVKLTSRELEILRWTCEGKTAYEVGVILSISERTVNFHVNNVLKKLAATNKVQAVVKAVSMGLFD